VEISTNNIKLFRGVTGLRPGKPLVRKYTFTDRVYTHMEQFIRLCIVSAKTVNTFKRRLDKFWSDQDLHDV